MSALVGQLRAFDALVPHAKVLVADVSEWSVGMHVHHCALATQSIVAAVARCDRPAPRWSPNPLRTLVLVTGRIPRGRARAPAAAHPAPDMDEAQLRAALSDAAEAVHRLGELPADAWFRHFALGVVRGRAVARFLQIHNRHHLRIIGDILTG